MMERLITELYKPRTVWPWLRVLGLAYAWLLVFGIFLIAVTGTGDVLLLTLGVPRRVGYPLSVAAVSAFVLARRRRGL
jgi:hypothetical protein